MDQPSAKSDMRRKIQALLSRKSRTWTGEELESLLLSVRSALGRNAKTDPITPPPRSTQPAQTIFAQSAPGLHPAGVYLRRIGPWSLLLGVARLIPSSLFWWQIAFVWIAGAAFLLDALCFEHWRKWVKAIAIATILVLEFGYSVAVGVGLPAPVELVGYSTPEHPIGSNIEGLAWHPHLTDARIAISNLSTTEYSKLDALIRPLADDPEPGMPYSLVYDARMVGESYGCHIYRAGGNSLNWGIASGKSAKAEAQDGKERKFTIGFTPAGDKVDGYDTDGDPYTTLANDGGFRLRCDSLPPMAGVIAMMAVISPPPRDSLPRLPARKEWSIAAGSFHGTSNPLDIMGDAPNVTSIQIDLDYIRGYRPFSRHEKISVRKQH